MNEHYKLEITYYNFIRFLIITFLYTQIVYLTFDDALTTLAEQNYYQGLFDGTFTNPDGCAIRATHFISARSNNYAMVRKRLNKYRLV